MIIQKTTFKNYCSIHKSYKFPHIESFESVILTDFKIDCAKVKTGTWEHNMNINTWTFNAVFYIPFSGNKLDVIVGNSLILK